jgi:hypothetical protein
LPFFRSASLAATHVDGKLIVRPVGGRDLFAWLRRHAGAGDRVALYLGAGRVVHSSVRALGEGGALVGLHGAFYRESWGGECSTEYWLGPLPEGEARAMAEALDRALRLPREPVRLEPTDLERDPGAYAGRLIELTDVWSTGLERSSFAGAWLKARHALGPGRSVRRVVGFYHRAPEPGPGGFGGDGYGHMGLSRAEIEVVTMVPPPDVPHAACPPAG